jgi:hypothetical protein
MRPHHIRSLNPGFFAINPPKFDSGNKTFHLQRSGSCEKQGPHQLAQNWTTMVRPRFPPRNYRSLKPSFLFVLVVVMMVLLLVVLTVMLLVPVVMLLVPVVMVSVIVMVPVVMVMVSVMVMALVMVSVMVMAFNRWGGYTTSTGGETGSGRNQQGH